MANRNDKKVEPERLNLLHANPGMARPQFKKVTYTERAFRAREVASAAPTRARAVLVYIDALYGPRGLRRPKEELENQGEDWGRRDYTDSTLFAIRGEPEAIDQTVACHYAAQNATRFEVLKAEEFARREVRSLQEKMRSVTRRARSSGIDVEPELERVRAALDDARRKVEG